MAQAKGISFERIREMLHYCPETGALTWRISRGNQIYAGGTAGTTNAYGYRVVVLDRKFFMVHRLAFMFMLGRMPLHGLDVDHIDRNRSNNSWANLREVSRAKNLRNMTAPEHKPPNVNRRGNRWQVTFSVENKTKYFGMYPTIEEAVEVAERVREKLVANLA